MTQVFYCSTFFGALTLAAAIDDGRFGPRNQRRLLVVSNNAAIPEISRAVDTMPGFDVLARRFDEVVSWNSIIEPLHPSGWTPGAGEVPMLSRLLSDRLGVARPSELILESIAVPPARTIAALLPDGPITVYSDGLMSYGPTRDPLPAELAGRIRRLLHLDLVPGLRPVLLRETGARAEPLPDGAFRKVLPDLPPAAADSGAVLILGQYLSALDIVTPAEEIELYSAMLRAVVARGHHDIAFKPHPALAHVHARELRSVAAELQIRLTVVNDAVPAEQYYATAPPALVVGCFSTGLLTAERLFDLPVATMGCDVVLERLTPYQNSNRIPATVVDASVPQLHADGGLTDPPEVPLQRLVEAVAFCMQAATYPELRPVAVDYLREFGRHRYFKKKRLEALRLVDVPASSTRRAARPVPQRVIDRIGSVERLRRGAGRT